MMVNLYMFHKSTDYQLHMKGTMCMLTETKFQINEVALKYYQCHLLRGPTVVIKVPSEVKFKIP